mmetsp:Transcript_12884/g.42065  ORF Transcript_12884/g.42065 Transcript_12884/m.42065 type:complete len:421 (-) Transcript_12884:59-1321(-)|eukprot:CAMPEP_0118915670 /NCGR_PEP_ID=MMETSP1166-20130328/15800_1 /TAXON_ID=1104430 /ORGANISM="Chrysoreinhardia sp, Strain CCMP3193" /LENGTH=420 /DNA_ID=CAMNT_0006855395 /DNA_START=19 /DNA_END=1281 /DNA_ORIENTATION=+
MASLEDSSSGEGSTLLDPLELLAMRVVQLKRNNETVVGLVIPNTEESSSSSTAALDLKDLKDLKKLARVRLLSEGVVGEVVTVDGKSVVEEADFEYLPLPPAPRVDLTCCICLEDATEEAEAGGDSIWYQGCCGKVLCLECCQRHVRSRARATCPYCRSPFATRVDRLRSFLARVWDRGDAYAAKFAALQLGSGGGAPTSESVFLSESDDEAEQLARKLDLLSGALGLRTSLYHAVYRRARSASRFVKTLCEAPPPPTAKEQLANIEAHFTVSLQLATTIRVLAAIVKDDRSPTLVKDIAMTHGHVALECQELVTLHAKRQVDHMSRVLQEGPPPPDAYFDDVNKSTSTKPTTTQSVDLADVSSSSTRKPAVVVGGGEQNISHKGLVAIESIVHLVVENRRIWQPTATTTTTQTTTPQRE